jgi:hypothetical protein
VRKHRERKKHGGVPELGKRMGYKERRKENAQMTTKRKQQRENVEWKAL